MNPDTFRCYLVKKTGKDRVETDLEQRPFFDLPEGDVLIRVAFSALNYKDALATTGHPGIVGKFPHVPGIDAGGTVVEDSSGTFTRGTEVVVNGRGLGSDQWGGWAEYIRVPADWVIPLPEGLSLPSAMIYGTAGLTAAFCVTALRDHGIAPDSGDVLVTGATGGVGLMAVKFLARLGYSVVAVSGKTEKHAWLKTQGASAVIDRSEVNDTSGRPMLSARWAGAVDGVGGNTLATVLRATKPQGCVAACGLVGGAELSMTVYPFILRGVTLAGIDMNQQSRDRRIDFWQKLAGDWKLDDLEDLAIQVPLSRIEEHVRKMLGGQLTGRVVIDPRG